MSGSPRLEPIWDATAVADDLAVLQPGVPADIDRRPDVAVVGGGVQGLAVAAMCGWAGIGSVLVLESGRLAGGPSGRAAGVLAPEIHLWTDPPAVVELGRHSLRLTRTIDAEWGGALGLRDLDCLLVGPKWSLPTPVPIAAPSTQLDQDALREREPAVAAIEGARVIEQQAHVHPVRFAAALVRRAGTVVTGVEVGECTITRGRMSRLTTTIGQIEPGMVVFATGIAPRPQVPVAHHMVKGHLAATEPVPFRLGSQVLAEHGVALQLADGRLLSGGTLDEGDASPDVRPEIVEEIHRELGQIVPAAASVRLAHAWCCFRPAAPDLLPIIDQVPDVENAWFTSGHYRTGLLTALGTADALAAWVTTGGSPQRVRPFSLARFV
jgi:glycine oxidase